MSLRTLHRALLLVAATVVFAGTAGAQAPTPEGDSIKNVATVTYNDGGTGSYNTKDSVVVMIGFKAGIDVTADATQRPASPSTDNSYSFVVQNLGNGVDTVAVTFPTVGTGLTITSWFIRSTEYASLAAFQAALANLQLQRNGAASGDTVTLTIEYSVAASRGGTSATIVPQVTSVRSTRASYGPGTVSGTVTLTVEPASVVVTPDNGSQSYAPGTRTLSFDVKNDASTSITYVLTSSVTASSILSGGTITGTGVTTVSGAKQITIAAGATAAVDVEFSVSNSGSFEPGDQGTLTLTATSTGASASVTDNGSYVVSLDRPKIVITKVARFADGVPIAPDTSARPGDVIHYVVSVRNDGNAIAQSVAVSDVLSSLLNFDMTLLNDATTPSVIRDTPPAAPYNDAWDMTGTGATGGVTTIVGTLPRLATGATRTFTIVVTVR